MGMDNAALVPLRSILNQNEDLNMEFSGHSSFRMQPSKGMEWAGWLRFTLGAFAHLLRDQSHHPTICSGEQARRLWHRVRFWARTLDTFLHALTEDDLVDAWSTRGRTSAARRLPSASGCSRKTKMPTPNAASATALRWKINRRSQHENSLF